MLDPVLDAVRTRRSERDGAEVALLKSVLDWAVEHTVVDPDEAATYIEEFGDTGLTLAGPGAPCVSEFDTYELAAALGMTSDSGKRYVGRALELRYRLPRIYARVVAGDLQLWRAGKIADVTLYLPEAGATYVDRMLAPTAHKVGIAQLDRLVEETLLRFDPEEAERRRLAAAEGRHFDVYTDHVGYEGTVQVAGALDLSDALDLDVAIRQGAKHLGDLGCEQPLDVRRSMAAGELARRQLALDLTAPEVEPVETPTGRGVTIVVHVADPTIARYGNHLISVEQVIAWCQTAGTSVKVQPLIDLNQAIQVGAYEIPDRIHQLVELRDHHCVFPHCNRPARCCDTDHITPYSECQRTDSDDLAPLCRMHHRTKTHSAWTYTALTPGEYLWTSPRGLRFKTDHTGTAEIDP